MNNQKIKHLLEKSNKPHQFGNKNYNHINYKNCTFGSKYTQSLQIWIKTVKYSNPYQLGKWIQENWADPIGSNVFHDRIQEGKKVRIAYIINTADTTNYRELQVDLERHLNNLYIKQKLTNQYKKTHLAPK